MPTEWWQIHDNYVYAVDCNKQFKHMQRVYPNFICIDVDIKGKIKTNAKETQCIESL